MKPPKDIWIYLIPWPRRAWPITLRRKPNAKKIKVPKRQSDKKVGTS